MVSVLNSVLCGGLHSACVVCGLIMKSVLYCACMCLRRIEQCEYACVLVGLKTVRCCGCSVCVWTGQCVFHVRWVHAYVCSEVCVPDED